MAGVSIESAVRTLLGKEAQEDRIEVSIKLASAGVLSRLKKYNPSLPGVPEELSYIIVDVAVARYNRIGSEGMTSETVEGISSTYISDLLDQYDDEIKAFALGPLDYKARQGRVKFL